MSLSILTVVPHEYTIDSINTFIQNCVSNNNSNIKLELIFIVLNNNLEINLDIYNNLSNVNIKIIKSNKDYNINYLLNISLIHISYDNVLYSNIDLLYTNYFFDFINKNKIKDNCVYIPRTFITSNINDILGNLITVKDLKPNYDKNNLDSDLNNTLSLEFSNDELLENSKNIFLNGANTCLILNKDSLIKLSGFPEHINEFNIDVFIYNLIGQNFEQIVLPHIISPILVKSSDYIDNFIKAKYIFTTYFNESAPDASYDFYSNDKKSWKRYRAHNTSKVLRGYKSTELLKQNKELSNKIKELEKKETKKNAIDGDSIKNTILESEKLILKKELQLQKIKTKINKLKQIEILKAELDEESSDE
jgi:hypothetical protein